MSTNFFSSNDDNNFQMEMINIDAELKAFMNSATRPQGDLGDKMIEFMNESHAPIWNWTLSHLTINKSDNVIDFGCGGGVNIQRFLEFCDKVTGLDYSPLCVQKSVERNIDAVNAGRCEIVEGNVSAIPFADKTFDVATAFETIYFWQDEAFNEVYRILKRGGRFLIGCGTSGESIFDNLVDGMKNRTADEIVRLLRESGFTNIQMDIKTVEVDTKVLGKNVMNWLSVLAIK